MLMFRLHETIDSWADTLQLCWTHVRDRFAHVKRLVIYMDSRPNNSSYMDSGPNNSGRRTRFFKRMVQFADWSGFEVRLIYYPPYHGKHNPVEHCWSALEGKWKEVLLSCVSMVLSCAHRMTSKGKHPEIAQLPGDYPLGVTLSRKEMAPSKARLKRSGTPPKYDITIKPESQAAPVT